MELVLSGMTLQIGIILLVLLRTWGLGLPQGSQTELHMDHSWPVSAPGVAPGSGDLTMGCLRLTPLLMAMKRNRIMESWNDWSWEGP